MNSKTRLIDRRAQFDQSVVDAAISQWRRRLSACIRVDFLAGFKGSYV